jgi:hypothetical protein
LLEAETEADDNKIKVYKERLSKIEEIIVRAMQFNEDNVTLDNSSNFSFSMDELEYFAILKMSIENNISALKGIVSDGTKDIKYRLYTYMQLEAGKAKKMREREKIREEAAQAEEVGVTKSLIEASLAKIKDSAFNIESVESGTSNLLTAGINLILTTTLRGAIRNDFSVSDSKMN